MHRPSFLRKERHSRTPGQPELVIGLGLAAGRFDDWGGPRPARRSQQNHRCQALGRPGRLPSTGRRSHEGMDWGAAAEDKNGANNLARQDRDNRPLPEPNSSDNSDNETRSPCGFRRGAYAPASSRRPEKTRQEALTPKALSGMTNNRKALIRLRAPSAAWSATDNPIDALIQSRRPYF